MIDPLAAFSLPRQRLSMQALVTVGVLHVALLWLMLQSGPAVQATRQVVMQYFSPITPLRHKPTPAPTPVRAATPAPKPVTVVASPPPRVETAVQPLQQTPAPIIRKMEAEPLPTAVPVLPAPEPLPVPELPPVPAPLQESVAPPVQTPPAPVPDPVVPPAAAPSVPIAAPTRAAAITPVESHTAPANAAGGTGSVSPQVAQPAAAGPPGGAGLNLNYNFRADGRGRQKTVSEMANEQLNGTGGRDKLAENVKAAEKPDCVNSGQALGILAPVAIAYNVVKDKCK